jgi:N-acetylglucosaminyl-diphospho-decaprenol L-rhamnosyltransferase
VDIAFGTSFTQPLRLSMPELPLLSIIIVAYKSRDEIGACLRSIPRELEGRSVEVIVVDNSPGDGTGEVVTREFPAVRYLPVPENIGFGRANNRGYAMSGGEFVLFLNPDTVGNDRALLHCLQCLRGDETIGLISPKLVQDNGAMDLACRRSIPTLWDGFARAMGLATRFPDRAIFSGYNLTHLPPDGTYDVGAINGAFMLAPRRVLTALAPDGLVFDERFFMYGDDLDLCIRVAKAGWRIVYDGSVSIIHVKGVSVAKDYDLMSRAIFDANRDVYLKHFGTSALARAKYRAAFAAWKWIAVTRARLRGHRRVRPL